MLDGDLKGAERACTPTAQQVAGSSGQAEGVSVAKAVEALHEIATALGQASEGLHRLADDADVVHMRTLIAQMLQHRFGLGGSGRCLQEAFDLVRENLTEIEREHIARSIDLIAQDEIAEEEVADDLPF